MSPHFSVSRTVCVLIFPVSTGIQSDAQKISSSDSIEIKTMIESFYSWYADLHQRESINNEFNPKFVRSSRGMTTLDFSNYVNGLRKHGFSKRFIKERLTRFEKCNERLKKIPYTTFTKFRDLDDFEQINCDFSNVNEWSGGMETPDGAELVDLVAIDNNRIKLKIKFYDERVGARNYWTQEKTFVAKKSHRFWELDEET